jgi:transcriptional regulator with XRE-family HTH domain
MGAMEKSVHTPEYRALRAELRRIRGNAGLSQRDLAARLRVPHSWVAKIENGERRIDLIEFCWFASACGADPLVEFEGLLRQKATLRTARHAKEAQSK